MDAIRRQPTAKRSKPQPTLHYGDAFGDCVINGFAGTGATSYVYRARKSDSFEPVAIKVLHPHLLKDAVKRERFLREAQIMLQLEHPNIVRFERIIDGEQDLAFIMEYVDGMTLSSWCERYAYDLDESVLACVFVDILRGLSHAHRHGIVHRDLKPGNVMITFQDGRYMAKIIDFGVARVMDSPMSDEEKNRIVGTAAYISPEEVTNPENVCPASDLYSLGVMLYEASCGRRPFEGMPVRDLLTAHVSSRPEAPRALNPNMTPAFESVILKTLQKQPEGRFESAPEMIRALELAIQGVLSMTEAQWDVYDDAETTTEWHRAVERVAEARRRPVFDALRRCFGAAVTLFMATGVRGDATDPHHLNRNHGADQLPFL